MLPWGPSASFPATWNYRDGGPLPIAERSAHTWFVLRDLLGYPKVRIHDGSLTGWIARGGADRAIGWRGPGGRFVLRPRARCRSAMCQVGSAYVPPKMSVLPNCGSQSCCGFGLAIGAPSTIDCRNALTPAQTAAFLTSTHTAAPKSFVATT